MCIPMYLLTKRRYLNLELTLQAHFFLERRLSHFGKELFIYIAYNRDTNGWHATMQPDLLHILATNSKFVDKLPLNEIHGILLNEIHGILFLRFTSRYHH